MTAALPFHIVLVEPEIPANTGNISRTCAATGAWLHLVKPLGFRIDDRELKRAGLDYWPAVKLEVHEHFGEVREKLSGARFFYTSTKGLVPYTEFRYRPGDVFVFGKETKGLPEELLRENMDCVIRIPMGTAVRSLNLSNAVAIVLYEALRQTGFPGLVLRGKGVDGTDADEDGADTGMGDNGPAGAAGRSLSGTAGTDAF